LNKKYLAVVSVESEKAETAGAFMDYMIKDGQVARIVSSKVAEAKEARLHYKLLKKEDNIALADIEIETGRFHQIRCQMAHHGMPLLGDAKYGSSQSVTLSQNLGIRNVALCANRIDFKHPVTGKVMGFEVEPANPAFGKFL
jgi:23S rRNA pseudouridine1911/1915/1917 synthase